MAGVRSSKTVGSTTYKYDTLSGKVMRQSWGSNVIDFVYDENNQPFAMRYNGTVYYYVLNVQGDVIGLLNANGAIAAKYTYDPWGKVTVQSSNGTTNTSSAFIGNINPLRYRGYYYDTDTGLYYLQSRYYDPEIGRFINADTYTTTDTDGLLSTNMFAYCENNPVMGSDPTGELLGTIAKMAIGAVAGIVTNAISNAIAGEPLTKNIGWAAIDGAATATAGTVAGALISTGISIFSGIANKESFGEIATNAAISAASSFAGGGASRLFGKLSFNKYVSTASKKSMKTLGNRIAIKLGEKSGGNKYKHIENWSKAMKNVGISKYSNSAYGIYLGYLSSSATAIIGTTIHTQTR